MNYTREKLSFEIQKLLNYVGGNYTFNGATPVFVHKDREEDAICILKTISLGEGCFVGFDSKNRPLYEDNITFVEMLDIITKLYGNIKISDLGSAYNNLELFFTWSLVEREKKDHIKTAKLGTDENYTIALDEFHKSCRDILDKFPNFACDEDDEYWYDDYRDNILELYMNFVDHKSFQEKK